MATRPESATAMYLFPLNSLAKDQQKKLDALNGALGNASLRVVSLTGDVPASERESVFCGAAVATAAPAETAATAPARPPDVFVTNPDLLHHQLAREWPSWLAFLARLRIVVLDEAHTYGGVFGAHLANLMRRLYNAVESAGGEPHALRFVAASATIANAAELLVRLTSHPQSGVVAISKSGAGALCRSVVFLNPAEDLLPCACRVAALWVQHGLQGIVFCNTLQAVDDLFAAFSRHYPRLQHLARCFYASLPAVQKADALGLLSAGAVKLLFATSALEAGVDLPRLDCCLLLGWPGARSRFAQRVGRAGRASSGLAMFLPDARSAVDRFIAAHPSAVFGCEEATCDPDYPSVLRGHLRCAAAERGVAVKALPRLFGAAAEATMRALVAEGACYIDDGDIFRCAARPHLSVSIRGGGPARSTVDVVLNDSVAERVSEEQAITRLYPGAVYGVTTERGARECFRVRELALYPCAGQSRAVLASTPCRNTRTFPVTYLDVAPLEVWSTQTLPVAGGTCGALLRAELGWAAVTTVVSGYKERDISSGKSLAQTRLFAEPLRSRHTAPYLQIKFTKPASTAVLARTGDVLTAFAAAESTDTRLKAAQWDKALRGCRLLAGLGDAHRRVALADSCALHTLAHQLVGLAPVHAAATAAAAGPQDVREACVVDRGGSVSLFLADSADGGSGVCEGIAARLAEAAAAAAWVCTHCAHCGGGLIGCSACVPTALHCTYNFLPLLAGVGAALVAPACSTV
eukprot:TRINITY_DN2746_c0_g1_i2.p1 TRINITY_DN2746_c0_g1~~TRINITY_DN2746_c0_g1_i2.p1  ORF type:complete len:750 (-),score=171.87 TRINITY_DN2746_c0_g1_i2:81-2330(-)